MRDTLSLYARYIGISLRAQMQYRASFIMLTVGQFLATGIEFLGVWALFARFGNMRGWQLPEIAMFYGIVGTAFALAEGIGRGFDTFANQVKSGGFDRILLRPWSTAFQIAASEVQLMRLGRFVQALCVLLWAVSALHITWTPAKAALVVFMILGGTCLFYGLFVLQATLSFWTVESLEIINTVTYGGTETAQYPLTIYRSWFRLFFTFVVPLASINYLPASQILERPHVLLEPAPWKWATPLVGVVFLLISLQVWKLGVSRYCSTGS